MLSFLPWPILLIINSILLAINTIVLSIPLLIVSIFKLILPFKFIIKAINNFNYWIYRIWVFNNTLTFKLTNKITWHIQGDNPSKIKGSCIIISNHISWADIIILLQIYQGKIPLTKFFLKQNLIYIPFLGQVCWSIGMPFMKRYSRAQLLKNPKLLNKDIATTKKACHSLIYSPSALVSFAEGTRYTKEKAKTQNSRFKHLLTPKPAALAIALGEVGDKMDCILDTTLQYPQNKRNAFIDLLCGRLHEVYANIEVIKITSDLIGDYQKDKEFKQRFTQWLRDLWLKKDEKIDNFLKNKN